MSLILVDPAIYDSAPLAPGTVVFRDEFNDTNLTEINLHTPDVDSAGNGWSKSGGWPIANPGGYVEQTTASAHTWAVVDIERQAVRIEVEMLAVRGTAPGLWTGIAVLGASAASGDLMFIRFNGSGTDPDLVISDGTSTTRETWDLSGLTTVPQNGDRVCLAAEFDPATEVITVELDPAATAGGPYSFESVGTYDLDTDSLASAHGSGNSAATFFGLYDNERQDASEFYRVEITTL